MDHSQPTLVLRSESIHAPSVDIDHMVRLSEKLVGDIAIATAVTGAVAPFLSIIDRSIVERSNGVSVLQSATNSITNLVRNPVAYAKSPAFLWMWATYAVTYATANSLKTISEDHAKRKGATTLSSSTKSAVFVGTTAANSTASIMKDTAYARMFGDAASVPKSVPRITYSLWMARDLTVIGSSFILPELVAPYLRDSLGEARSLQVAQIVTPVAAQTIAGPLHYGALDFYNRQLSHLPMSQRVLERAY